MRSSSVKCFGIGDGWPCSDRNHSSFLYRCAEAALLIDCGEPISRSFKASGLGYDSFDRILLSHLHCDHVGGFFMFMQGLWLESRKKVLPVHMPEYAIEPVRQMLRACYIFEELFSFRLEFVPLRAGEPISSNGLKVTPYPTTHLESLRRSFAGRYPQPFQAFSFLMEAKGKRIAHSADLGAPEDLEPLLRRPVDLLVCELAHFQPEALFKYLEGRPIGRIVFIHLDKRLWENLDEIQALAEGMLPGIPCQFARDGDEFSF